MGNVTICVDGLDVRMVDSHKRSRLGYTVYKIEWDVSYFSYLALPSLRFMRACAHEFMQSTYTECVKRDHTHIVTCSLECELRSHIPRVNRLAFLAAVCSRIVAYDIDDVS